jgi:hypothetical protein
MRRRLCRWDCGRKTDRICGICLYCCDERDRQIASGAPYIPPSERLGHRLYKGKRKKPITDSQRQALDAARVAKLLKQMPRAGFIT